MKHKAMILSIIGLIALFGNWIGYKVSPIEALPGIIIIVVVTLIGWSLTEYLPFKILVWISLLALLITSPEIPGNSFFAEQKAKITSWRWQHPFSHMPDYHLARMWTVLRS